MKQKAIFLDRDGVLTVEKGYVTSLEQLEIFPYAKKCVKEIHRAGYLAIVITNQSAVGRRLLQETELIRMNEFLKEELHIDKVYYCPHYSSEYSNENSDEKNTAKSQCGCRKPDIGLVIKAKEEYNIDLDNSFFVGDRDSDIQTGINSGLKTVLVESGYGSKRLEAAVVPNFICEDLEEFVMEWVLKLSLK